MESKIEKGKFLATEKQSYSNKLQQCQHQIKTRNIFNPSKEGKFAGTDVAANNQQ